MRAVPEFDKFVEVDVSKIVVKLVPLAPRKDIFPDVPNAMDLVFVLLEVKTMQDNVLLLRSNVPDPRAKFRFVLGGFINKLS
jgi:hypothetical protein